MSLLSKTQWTGLIALILALSGLTFYEGLDNGLIFDDVAKIKENPDIQLPEFSMSNFIYPYDQNKLHNRSDPSRPLTFMSFWLSWQIGSGASWPFHLTSIIIHALSAFLLAMLAALLAQRMGLPSPFLAAVIASLWFLTLPLNAGTVIYAYGLSDVLATMFMLAVVLTLFEREAVWAQALAVVLYILAFASKQSAIVIPGVVFTIDFFTSKDWSFLRRRSTVYATLAVTSIAYLAARFLYFGGIGDLEAYDQFRVMIYLPLQGIMHWNYVARIFLPISLTVEHAHNPSMFTYSQCYLSWAFILFVAFLSLWFGRRSKWSALVALGWCLFFIGLSPTSTFFTTTDLFVERRAYTPSAFTLLCWGTLIGGALPLLAQVQRRVWAGILSLMLIFNILVSREQVAIYGDEERLWRGVLKLYFRDERAMVNLTTYYLKVEKFPEAKNILEILLKMYPNYYSGLINFGAYYQHPRNPERNLYKAHDYYKAALLQEPNNLSTLMNGGLLMLDMGNLPQARIYFGRVVELNPKIAAAHFGLARVEYVAGNRTQARKHVEETLRLAPDYPQADELMRTLR